MTVRFAADENLHNDILRGVLRRQPNLDIVRVQDTAMYEAEDVTLLEWAAKEGRILLTHDTRTMPNYAYQRLREGKPLAGVFIINDHLPIGQVVNELLAVAGASEPEEWENRVVFLPL
jgi:predicted nuclease of predicted toxin-antitoxin system